MVSIPTLLACVLLAFYLGGTVALLAFGSIDAALAGKDGA